MSWELMMTLSCGCQKFTDDWNRTKTSMCISCKEKKIKNRMIRDRDVAKKTKRCIECVRRDSYGVMDSGGRYFSEGKCLNCKNLEIDKLKKKYNLESLTDINELKSNEKVKEEYFFKHPKARGVETRVFKIWVEKLFKV